ncbi:DSBA oxidoreductase [Lysobacter daejeonensis GH1-9]|uniref:DSBA oxidoreductase n=1 Tax=Lysobacter daejeonensis GH1-9 TaxID=1385517 RepID=A0A0A0EWA1_9GAMM|nr:DsbA family oxidoreductase [Lysobacter daejeonensis]KGM53392.1 DSBA oxidoreductase [Lysobacter daejeonensis GH1-9]
MTVTPIDPPSVRIDFVSDVACPWCAVGLNALEQAIADLSGAVQVDLHFQPFELNPQMAAEGEDADEHLARKYGLDAAQLAQNREVLRQRGADVGFTFGRRGRVVNTFDAHRLLHWAGEQSPALQRALKHALLRAYFTDGRDVSDSAVLVDVATSVGLDAAGAAAILASDAFVAQVREQEQVYQARGIRAVPSVILNDRHLIQGGQPPELFARALRQVAGVA